MNCPSILVDGLVFENNYQVGIWRVYYEILNRIADRAHVTLWLQAPAVQPLPKVARVVKDNGRITSNRWKIARRFQNKIFPRDDKILRESFPVNTVFHSTYFTPCPFSNMPQVTTVYDMIAESYFPIMGAWTAENSNSKFREIQKAKNIITISHSAAASLSLFYPNCTPRITAIHLGGDHLLQPHNPPAQLTSQSNYALFVGARAAYKNFHTLLHAMNNRAWPDFLKLHVVGSPFSIEESRLVHALGLESKVKNFGAISDDELRLQYKHATCFIFPSLAEGFGLPILEAQMNSCPVVCSDIAVFREVAGEGAIYFDPRLAESLAEAIRILHHRPLSNEYISKGRENARKFTWDRAAKETLEVYIRSSMES